MVCAPGVGTRSRRCEAAGRGVGGGRAGASSTLAAKSSASEIAMAHHRVALGQRALIGMEGVGVLHDELARTHHAEARPHLVAELELDLVEVDRQLAIAFDLAPRDIRDHLFVGGPEHEVALVAILQAQQLRAEFLPATRFLPELGRLDRRHQQLQRSGAVHLLADDGFDLAQRAQPERQPAVDPGRDAANHAGAQHQLVADDISLGRRLLDGIDRVLRQAHAAGGAVA